MDFQARTKKYPTCKKQREVIKLAVPIPCLCIQDFGNGLLGIISDMEIIKIGTVKNSAIFILRHKS
jgi:hypothetical protein